MTPTDYLYQSERTAADTFFPRMVSQSSWAEARYSVRENLELLDKIKKGVFYGRHTGMEAVHDVYEHPIDIQDKESFHAVLGILTEGGELLDLIDSDATKEKWIDEAGDVLWYLALLFRRHGITFEQVMRANIAKLMARFPEKFEPNLANHRNDEAEMLALKAEVLD